MKFLLRYISIIIFILQKTYSQGSTKVPGSISSCYYGALQEKCKESTVPATDLPGDSLFYDGIRVDATLNVAFSIPERNNDEYMKSLLSTGKPVFLHYYHKNDDALFAAIVNNTQDGGASAKIEMANLKKFLEPYKNIAGLAVTVLNTWPFYTEDPCLTENLKIYIDEMRNCFPDYGIGLYINGFHSVKMFNDVDPSSVWFHLSDLDKGVDFYVIDVYNLNDCSEKFKKGGTTPIYGDAPCTLETVKACIEQLGPTKEKIFYELSVSPSSIANVTDCDVINAKVCARPNLDGLCADTIQTFYDKGKFVKQFAAGFIIWNVDLDDDPHECCQCGTPYPAFNTISAGFKGDPIPPPCPLLDKP